MDLPRNITGPIETTPTAPMILITSLTLLDLYVKEVALMSMLRLRRAGVNPKVGETLTALPAGSQ